jgi:hypothetical protein
VRGNCEGETARADERKLKPEGVTKTGIIPTD